MYTRSSTVSSLQLYQYRSLRLRTELFITQQREEEEQQEEEEEQQEEQQQQRQEQEQQEEEEEGWSVPAAELLIYVTGSVANSDISRAAAYREPAIRFHTRRFVPLTRTHTERGGGVCC